MDPSCRICHKHHKDEEDWFLCRTCEPVAPIVDKLNEEKWELERRLDSIKERVLLILSSICDRDCTQPTIEVETKKILELWTAAELQWYDAKTAPDFLEKELVEGMVQIMVRRLFEKDGKNFFVKLQEVLDALKNVYDHHGWEFKLDKSVDNIKDELA